MSLAKVEQLTNNNPMDNETRRCLQEVIEYLWDDEQKSWMEHGRPADHIYPCLVKLNSWLGNLEVQDDE